MLTMGKAKMVLLLINFFSLTSSLKYARIQKYRVKSRYLYVYRLWGEGSCPHVRGRGGCCEHHVRSRPDP